MLYFSYGSNMSSVRLRERVPSANFFAVAKLFSHELKFHKISKDGSGKCDAHNTGLEEDVVIGAIYKIEKDEKSILDKFEGLGVGYGEKRVCVTSLSGEELRVVTYLAKDIVEGLQPFEWYKEHVLRGAREHKLPAEYIKFIYAIKATSDSNKTRHADELSIYKRI